MKLFKAKRKEAQKLYSHFSDDWKDFTFEEGTYEVSDNIDLATPVNRHNMYMTLQALDGTDYKAVLGKDCLLDHVKITAWEPDTCGCRTTFLWRRDHAEDVRQTIPHRGERHCQHHAHMKDDHSEHCHELWGENRHKNLSQHALAEHLSVPVGDVRWAHDSERKLGLFHPKLTDDTVRAAAKEHLDKHEHASKRPFVLSSIAN